MNHYPLWKYLLIAIVIAVCSLYALPNLFGEDPSVQISPAYARNMKITESLQERVEGILKDANLEHVRIDRTSNQMLIRFRDNNIQLKAFTILKESISDYVVAQNLAPATPNWLRNLGGSPMYLGLDLRGGVHFLMQIDMETAVKHDEEILINDFRTLFREKKVRYKGNTQLKNGGVQFTFLTLDAREQAKQLVTKQQQDLIITEEDEPDIYRLNLAFSEKSLKENSQKALEQNITTLRNRVNELGVAEPVIQRQGDSRIVVQLPGVQDTAGAKEILGATATLEFRLLADEDNKLSGREYKRRDGPAVWLKRNVIATGDQINDAAATIDQRSGRPATVVRLDSKGAKSMFATTRKNVGKPMAVVFINYLMETKIVDGKPNTTSTKQEEVINVATIQEEFGKNFQITGLTSSEASNLALLLRAGALKAPMEIIEERTIGPSLGKENIELGLISIMFGFISVMIFMLLRYKTFGMIANVALLANVVILVAMLSLIQATLTLPGIAGIVLTLGMAVDANVLIFEKIREEIANGNSPQTSIHMGYEKAFITIFDSNLTTLIAAVMLFGFGTGPIKGFAITLSLGIITSMFTAIMGTRAIVNFVYGKKTLTRLSV